MVLEADLVLLALGFKHPVHEGFLNHLEISYDPRGYVSVDDNYQTSNPKVFAVGDAVEGPSLIVKALASGRAATGHIHGFLIYKSPVINHATKKKSGGKSVSINSAS